MADYIAAIPPPWFSHLCTCDEERIMLTMYSISFVYDNREEILDTKSDY